MKKIVSISTIIALVLGILGGIFIPDLMNSISFIGNIYVNLLKFMIIPIIFTSIMVTVYSSSKSKTKILGKTLLVFILMFVTTFLITSLIVAIFKPGYGFKFTNVEWVGEVSELKISDIITNLFPSNIITMIQGNNIFASIIFAVICGLAASRVTNGDKAIEVVESFKNIFSKILEYIMYLTPIGVFALIGATTANYGTIIFGIGLKYIAMAYLCGFITLLLVMILPAWFIGKINPIIYVKKVFKVWIMTLTTCSSAATLPCTIKTCNEELNIPKEVTDIVVPLGCTIHMCGGAVSFALLGLFCSQLFVVEINLITYIIMIVSATLINMAAPGIPNGGIVLGATYLSMLGMPLSFIGFYSGIYKILDMLYTTLNVTGDITANIIIAHNAK